MDQSCSVDRCDVTDILAKGFCARHYHAARRRPVTPVLCATCGVVFRPTSGKAKYCGSECRSTSLRKHKAERRAKIVAAIDPVWKDCGRCGERRPRTEYRKDAKRLDGLYPWCISCWRAYVGAKAKVRASESKQEYDRARRERMKREVGQPALSAAHREAHLLRTFNITSQQYADMLDRQDGRCAICRLTPEEVGVTQGGRAKSLAVDHDHACCPGSQSCGDCVRSLLCTHCNTGIGMFKDDPELLHRAAAYFAGQHALHP